MHPGNLFILIPLFFLLVIALIVALIMGLLIWLLRRFKTRQKMIGDTPVARIGELEDGLGKVRAKILAIDRPLVSPLSRTECVYFCFRVEEQRTRVVSGGPRGGSHTQSYWHPVIKDRQAARCWLEDSTGRAKIDLLEAETVLETSAHSSSGFLRDAPARLERLLKEQYGYSTRGLLFNKTTRYIEEVIEDGDRLFVFGEVQLRKDGTPAFFKGEHPFIVSDRNEQQLLQHYRSKITWCYVGMGITGVLGAIFAAFPLFFLVIGLMVRQAMPGASNGPSSVNNAPVNNNPPANNNAPANNNPPANNNVPVKDPIAVALDGLRSPEPWARRRAAATLTQLPVDEARRAEVVGALTVLVKDEDRATQVVARRALAIWDRPANDNNQRAQGPGAPEPPAPPPPVDPNVGRPKQPEPVKIPWEVKLDPAPAQEGPFDLTASLPTRFMGLAVLSTSPHSSMLAMPPPGLRDKSKVQVYNLRTMKPVGVPISGPFGGHAQGFALSPDGTYFATLLQGTRTSTIEAWSSATGQSMGKIEVDPDPEMKVTMLDFVWDNHAITMKHRGQFPDFETPSFYQVWDIRTGKEVAHFEYDLRFLHRWGSFTPGRRYMVMEHTQGRGGYHIYFWDLKTGKMAGDLELQQPGDPWGQAAGIAFTPDGARMALLWRMAAGVGERYFQLMSFDIRTGKKLHNYKITNEGAKGEFPWTRGGSACIQWVPDGSGWLLFGFLLVDYQTGQILTKLGKPPGWDGELVDRRFLDAEHVTTLDGGPFDKKLRIMAVPGK